MIDDEDEEESSISLAAMESALKPQIIETFEQIATTFTKLQRAQDKLLATA